MTDKVQKIRKEVERIHNLLPIMDGDNISINYADRICTTLEMYIDSLQKEPVSEDWLDMSKIDCKIQYANIESGIHAHAEDYSFNIESQLFNQLTKEQQELWRKEIEQAVISGGHCGVELARDKRYKENQEPVSEDLELAATKYAQDKYMPVQTSQAFKAGAQWQKEQLMASGTDVTVHIEAGNYPYIPQIELYDYDKDIPLAKEGDKYKVILIKED